MVLKLKLQYFGHLMRRVDSLEKTLMLGGIGGRRRRGQQDEMAGWHHGLDGRESEWTPGVGDGQGGLACCDSWGRKESDTTGWLNWTELSYKRRHFLLPCKPSCWIPSPGIIIPAPAASFSFHCHMCTSGQSLPLWTHSATPPLHRCSQLAISTTHTHSDFIWPLPPFWLPLLTVYLWITPTATTAHSGLVPCCYMHAYSQPSVL